VGLSEAREPQPDFDPGEREPGECYGNDGEYSPPARRENMRSSIHRAPTWINLKSDPVELQARTRCRGSEDVRAGARAPLRACATVGRRQRRD
jgi:hypothetical protein